MIRPIAPEDIPALHAMLCALAADDRGTITATAADLRKHGFGLDKLYHALIDTDGMVIYYPDFSTHRGQPGAYVQDLYVAPRSRGLGLAKRLLQAVLQTQTWGAQYLTLGANPGNARAARFYAKLGFQATGYDFLILRQAAKALE